MTYNVLSAKCQLTSLMGKSYNYEVNLIVFRVFRNILDPDLDPDSRSSGSGLRVWLDPDPDSIEYGSETLLLRSRASFGLLSRAKKKISEQK